MGYSPIEEIKPRVYPSWIEIGSHMQICCNQQLKDYKNRASETERNRSCLIY